MAQRFEITINRRQVWYYYSLYDRLTDRTYTTSKGYNSEGGAKEAAILVADQLIVEDPPVVYEYGPEF